MGMDGRAKTLGHKDTWKKLRGLEATGRWLSDPLGEVWFGENAET